MTDISKILKHAPSGLKLFSPLFGEVTFCRINFNDSRHPILIKKEGGDITGFTSDGHYFSSYPDAECLLFPSSTHRTWDDWQTVLFQKGDIIASDNGVTRMYVRTHLRPHSAALIDPFGGLIYTEEIYEYFYASPDEVQQFLANLKEHGYRKEGDTIVRSSTDAELKQPTADATPTASDTCQFKPFDKVLVRDYDALRWKPNIYSYYNKGDYYPHVCIDNIYRHCIPYNEETAHLLGTTQEAPAKYRNL